MEVDEGLVSFDGLYLSPSKPTDLAKNRVTQLLLHIPSKSNGNAQLLLGQLLQFS